VAGTVAHQLCHAALGNRSHGARFKTLTTATGLAGKMTQTIEGPLFLAIMPGIIDRIGHYPIGKQPIHICREVPGHVANRLQAALWREALHLVAEGVASVADVDTAISAGPGLRWALMGPHLTFHLAGGVGGIDHFLDQFAAPMAS
jgi:3-hydroxyacyl-CoA dehydrogenase, C-terminal domain